MTDTEPIIRIENISKTFNIPGRAPVKALQDVSNHVDKGEVLVLIGPSGSGKSTLLRTLNGLENVDSGKIFVGGIQINDSKTDLNKLRESVGMVFQHFNLFQHKTAIENITLPQMVVLKRSRAEAEKKAKQLLERVGIGEGRHDHQNNQHDGSRQHHKTHHEQTVGHTQGYYQINNVKAKPKRGTVIHTSSINGSSSHQLFEVHRLGDSSRNTFYFSSVRSRDPSKQGKIFQIYGRFYRVVFDNVIVEKTTHNITRINNDLREK